jgi:hypothetical protein
MGVKGIKLGKDDCVIAVENALDHENLLFISEYGYSKRTEVGDFKEQGRAGKGLIAPATINTDIFVRSRFISPIAYLHPAGGATLFHLFLLSRSAKKKSVIVFETVTVSFFVEGSPPAPPFHPSPRPASPVNRAIPIYFHFFS